MSHGPERPARERGEKGGASKKGATVTSITEAKDAPVDTQADAPADATTIATADAQADAPAELVATATPDAPAEIPAEIPVTPIRPIDVSKSAPIVSFDAEERAAQFI